jgi:uncharacterized NAD-dependent epimerase/dehydratase family protein
MKQTATILARGYFSDTKAKTAHGLIRHGTKYRIVSVIDETMPGCDAGLIIGLGHLGIPIVMDLDTSADVLIIGVAPSGGKLPPKWREDIMTALKNGMDVVSGLHEFLSDDLELFTLARENNAKLIDIRLPPAELHIAKQVKPKVPVVFVSGTDAASGKRTTALELYNYAKKRGFNPGFIATGQTGMMIGCDAGICVDHLPTDFVAGEVEQMVQDVIKQGKDLIFIEGQGALLHHAYSTSTIGILHGAQPNYIILVHPVTRPNRASFPKIPVPAPEEEIAALEKLLPGTKVIGIALNCNGEENFQDLCNEFEERLGLPTVDVVANRADTKRLLEKILEEIVKDLGLKED